MYKKVLGMLLMGALFFFCSCVDDTYDLNKEIATDVAIKGNRLTLPLGSLRPIVIDSLIGNIDMIETTKDGVYAIKRGDSIHPVEQTINPIVLEIEDQRIELKGLTQSLAPSVSRKTEQSKSIAFKFDEKTCDFSFEEEIDRQIKRIEMLTFDPIKIEIKVEMNALGHLTNSAANLDLTLEFPECFNKLECHDTEVTTEGNIVTIRNKKYDKEGLTIDLYIESVDFKNSQNKYQGLTSTESGGKNTISYQGDIKVSGNLSVDINNIDISQFDKIDKEGLDMNIVCSFGEINVKTFHGIYYDNFDVEKSFPINLGDQFDFLKDNSNRITLAAPQIEVILYSTISFPTNIELEIIGKDKEGNEIKETEIIFEDPIRLEAAMLDAEGKVIPTQKRLLITKENQPNLAHILEFMPDSMSLYVRPVIDVTETHHIDIEQKLDISARYNVILPLQFEELYIEYCDTIALNLEETLSSLDDASIKVKMDVANTIPLDLKFEFIALDKNDNIIEGIPTTTTNIKSGNGDNIYTANPKKQTIDFNLSCSNLSLDKLKLDITAKTNGSIAEFKSKQGLQISNIVIEAIGDIIIKED